MEVEDSNGAITVEEKGKSTLNTSFGAIEASGLRKGVQRHDRQRADQPQRCRGDAYAKTSFGAVNVQRVNGNLTIENTNGPVSANAVKGDAAARTSFGSVTLDEIGGSITVDNQNGAVAVSRGAHFAGMQEISLKTSFSPMQVRLPDRRDTK